MLYISIVKRSKPSHANFDSPAHPWEASGDRISDAVAAPGTPRAPGLVARRPPERAAGNESETPAALFVASPDRGEKRQEEPNSSISDHVVK